MMEGKQIVIKYAYYSFITVEQAPQVVLLLLPVRAMGIMKWSN